MVHALISPIDPVWYIVEYVWEPDGTLNCVTAVMENAFKVVDVAAEAFPVADPFFWCETASAERGGSYYDTTTKSVVLIPIPPIPAPPANLQPVVSGVNNF